MAATSVVGMAAISIICMHTAIIDHSALFHYARCDNVVSRLMKLKTLRALQRFVTLATREAWTV